MSLLSSSLIKTLTSTIFITAGVIVLVKSSWNILYISRRVVVSTLGSCSVYSSAWNDSSSCVVDDSDNILYNYTTARARFHDMYPPFTWCLTRDYNGIVTCRTISYLISFVMTTIYPDGTVCTQKGTSIIIMVDVQTSFSP